MSEANYKIRINKKPLEAIQTLAEVLVHARTMQERSLDEAAETLKISPLYLHALEVGDYASLPCFVYTRNFVKHYGKWLGLRVQPLLELFEQEWQLFSKVQSTQICPDQSTGVKKTDMWTVPRWLRFVGAFFVILLVLSYFGYELYDLRQPPKLVIETPQEELVIESQLVEIKGETEPEAVLTINDQTILSDTHGNFNEMIALQPGLNIIEVAAKRKHSQENVLYRKVFVTETPAFTRANRVGDES